MCAAVFKGKISHSRLFERVEEPNPCRFHVLDIPRDQRHVMMQCRCGNLRIDDRQRHALGLKLSDKRSPAVRDIRIKRNDPLGIIHPITLQPPFKQIPPRSLRHGAAIWGDGRPARRKVGKRTATDKMPVTPVRRRGADATCVERSKLIDTRSGCMCPADTSREDLFTRMPVILAGGYPTFTGRDIVYRKTAAHVRSGFSGRLPCAMLLWITANASADSDGHR